MEVQEGITNIYIYHFMVECHKGRKNFRLKGNQLPIVILIPDPEHVFVAVCTDCLLTRIVCGRLRVQLWGQAY